MAEETTEFGDVIIQEDVTVSEGPVVITGDTGRRTPEGRPILSNNKGGFSTELTITVDAPGGGFMVIPSIFGGKIVSQEEAIQIVNANGGVDPETGRKLPVFGSIAEADTAAQQRSSSLSGEETTTDFGDPLLQEAVAGEAAFQVATGVNEGLAQTLGLPVDIVNSGLQMLGLGTDEPFLGSKSLQSFLESAGVMQAEKVGFEAERRIGKEIGATLPFIGGVGVLARGAKLAATGVPTLGRALIEPAIQRPARTMAGELVAATGAGAGAAVAEKVAPGSQGAEITGQIIGGVAPSLAPTALIARGIGSLTKRFSPKAQEKKARELVQGLLGEEVTTRVAQDIRAGQDVAGQIPGFTPSTAEISGSPSLIATQRAREQGLSGTKLEQAIIRQEENTAAINSFANSKAPTGTIEVDAVIDVSKRKVDDLLGDIESGRATQTTSLPKIEPDLKTLGSDMRQALIERRSAASQEMSRLADQLGLNEFDISQQFNEIRDELINIMTPSGRFANKADTPDLVKILKDDRFVIAPTTLEDLKLLREQMGADLRAANSGTAPDRKKARFLSLGIKQLDDSLDNLQFPTEAINAQYKQFRQEYFDTVILPFERNAAFKVKQKGSRGQYLVDDERVAAQFFGPKKDTDMEQFVSVFGDSPEQMNAMRSVIVDNFNKAVVRDGKINPKLMESWNKRFSSTLDQIPGVKAEMADVTTANKALERRNASMDLRQRQIEDTLLSKKLKAFTAGTKEGSAVIEDAIKNPKLMRQLTNSLRNDPDALTSLKRHVWDSVIDGDVSTMQKNIKANQKSLDIALGKRHMDEINKIMKAREMVERTLIKGGQPLSASPLEKVEEAIGMGIPALSSRIYAVRSGRIGANFMATEMASRFLRGVTGKEMTRLMDEALYNPQIAKDLADAIKFPNKPAIRNKMKKHLFNLGAEERGNENVP